MFGTKKRVLIVDWSQDSVVMWSQSQASGVSSHTKKHTKANISSNENHMY